MRTNKGSGLKSSFQGQQLEVNFKKSHLAIVEEKHLQNFGLIFKQGIHMKKCWKLAKSYLSFSGINS